MSLSERGLMMSMLCECWVNSYVPSDISQLAKILGYSNDEVSQSLSTNVMHFFFKDNDRIICPELIAYRNKLDERQRLQIEGGKKGALKKKEKEKEVTSSYPEGIPEGSLIEHNLTENNLIKHTTEEQVFREGELTEENKLAEHQEWIEDMNKAESYF
jgi:hypothetical protein